MRAAVSLTDGLGLDGDRCIRVIPRHPPPQFPTFYPVTHQNSGEGVTYHMLIMYESFQYDEFFIEIEYVNLSCARNKANNLVAK